MVLSLRASSLLGFRAEIACWMYTGERQVGALRRRYLEAVLRQDVGFFDTDARTGDVVFSVSIDTLLVQDAIGEKVAKPIPLALLPRHISWLHDSGVPKDLTPVV
jgi:ABC-type multidrug transport system fused ATPase/permease subunit